MGNAESAPQATIHVLTGNGLRGAFQELLPAFEREHGCTVAVSYDPAQIILQRIDRGEMADIAIVGKAALDDLIRRGKVEPGSETPIARCGVGVGVRRGAPKPDISSVEAFKRALIGAPTVAYTTSGASGIHFMKVIEKLGISEEIRAKGRTQPGGLIGEIVERGEAELAIQQIPEIKAVRGVDYVGPLPDAVQNYTDSVAGIFVGAPNASRARKLLDFLASSRAAEVLQAKGLEPAVRAGR